jgi:hypothetical protein
MNVRMTAAQARKFAAQGMITESIPSQRSLLDTVSPGECAAAEVVAWCKLYKWPLPEREHRFALHIGRKWRFDLAWPRLMVAVEFQGGIGRVQGRHTRPTGFTDDCEKFSTAATLGWRILPVTYPQVKSGQLLNWLETILTEAK